MVETSRRKQRSVMLRYPALAILMGGQWVSQIGNGVFSLALPWLVFDLYHSTVMLGVVGGVGEAAALVSVFSGVFVDRWDRRKTMIVADVVRASVCFGLFLMADRILASGLAVLLGLVVALELSGSFFGGAAWALIPVLVEREDLTRATGAMRAATTSAGMIGRFVGGAIIGAVSAAGGILADAISFAASVLSLGLVRTSPHETPDKLEGLRDFWAEFVTGQTVIWGDIFLTRLVVLGSVLGLFSTVLATLDVAWVRVDLHGNSLAYAGFWIAAGAGGIIGGLVVNPLARRLSVRGLNAASLVAAGLAVALLSRLPVLVPDLGLMGVMGFALAVQSTSLNVAIQQSVPSEVLGRVGGALGALTASTIPLGAALSGVFAGMTSVSLIFLISGLAMAAIGALVSVVLPTAPGNSGKFVGHP